MNKKDTKTNKGVAVKPSIYMQYPNPNFFFSESPVANCPRFLWSYPILFFFSKKAPFVEEKAGNARKGQIKTKVALTILFCNLTPSPMPELKADTGRVLHYVPWLLVGWIGDLSDFVIAPRGIAFPLAGGGVLSKTKMRRQMKRESTKGRVVAYDRSRSK